MTRQAPPRCLSRRRTGRIRCELPAHHVAEASSSIHWGRGPAGRWYHWPVSPLDALCAVMRLPAESNP